MDAKTTQPRCLAEIHGPDLATAHHCGCDACMAALDAWTGHTPRRCLCRNFLADWVDPKPKAFRLPRRTSGLAALLDD